MQAQRSHRKFLVAVEPPTAMLGLADARRLVNRGETADSWFPERTSAIVTSTISDTKLNLISWEREYDIIRAFEPTYHIPTDAAVYDEQSAEQRRENIAQCMEGTLWMAGQLADTDVTVLPLIKGLEPNERELCYRVFERIDAEQCVFYVRQAQNLALQGGDVAPCAFLWCYTTDINTTPTGWIFYDSAGSAG